MEKIISIPEKGLNPTPYDSRDFSRHEVFGSIAISKIPDSFTVSEPLEIKDQGSTDFCAAYAASEVAEDQDGIAFTPEWLFAQIKKESGDFSTWGLDLRQAAKGAVNYGFLPKVYNPFKEPEARDTLANWANWPANLASLADDYKKKTFFAVDGPNDTFDNFKTALWMNRAEKRSIITGALWCDEWTFADRGIIETAQGTPRFGHAFKVFGVDGNYLIAQLSNGTDIGDKGIFRFSRKAVNEAFTYGAYTFKDLTKEEAQWYIENKIKSNDNWVISFIKAFIRPFRK